MNRLIKNLSKYEWKSYIIFSLYVIMSLILVWIVASYFDVLAHNTLGDETYEYWTFNFFNLFD